MTRTLLVMLLGTVTATALFLISFTAYEQQLSPSLKPGEMPTFEIDRTLITPNTVRIGTDDPIETAVAVSQAVYPATEEENTPGAVILANRANLAEAMLAVSRVSHFPINAPLLFVNSDSIPEITRNELLRLEPEGVPIDRNVQVYIVGGSISEQVVEQVEALGYKTRVFSADDPIQLSEDLDNWTSTIHGDHEDEVVVANLDNLEMAIPSAFWNAHAGDGLVFVTNDGIPETTIDILERRYDEPWLYLFGDESVIPNEIARGLAQYGQVTRMPRGDLPSISTFFAGHHDTGENWGAWWFESARMFGWGNAEAGRNAIFVNVNGPAGWQNALPATTLSHMGKHAPVLVVDQDTIPEPVARYLRTIKPYPVAPQRQLLNHGWIIGGEATISWNVQAEIDLFLDAYVSAPEAEQ